MKRFAILTFFVTLAVVFPALVATAGTGDDSTGSSYDADSYAPCAACHLADGAGIPGAFPVIRNRATAMAALAGGRRYLITVVSYGLMGPISADGSAYAGAMPGHGSSMQPDTIASALNYLVFQLTDNTPDDIAAFTRDEVEAVQNATKSASPMNAANMRKSLIEQHGEKWPN